jgi:hypothetical protein
MSLRISSNLQLERYHLEICLRHRKAAFVQLYDFSRWERQNGGVIDKASSPYGDVARHPASRVPLPSKCKHQPGVVPSPKVRTDALPRCKGLCRLSMYTVDRSRGKRFK